VPHSQSDIAETPRKYFSVVAESRWVRGEGSGGVGGGAAGNLYRGDNAILSSLSPQGRYIPHTTLQLPKDF